MTASAEDQNPNRIKIAHWAALEGRAAVLNGYTGRNPYRDQNDDAAKNWMAGYLAEIAVRLEAGGRALPRHVE